MKRATADATGLLRDTRRLFDVAMRRAEVAYSEQRAFAAQLDRIEDLYDAMLTGKVTSPDGDAAPPWVMSLLADALGLEFSREDIALALSKEATAKALAREDDADRAAAAEVRERGKRLRAPKALPA